MLNLIGWKAKSNTQGVELDNVLHRTTIYLLLGSMRETNQYSCQLPTKGVVERR